MRIDLYTKTMLTLIVLLLATVACKSLVQPNAAVADGPLAGVQFSMGMAGLMAIDTRTGELWLYDGKNAKYGGRITKLGEPLDLTLRKSK